MIVACFGFLPIVILAVYSWIQYIYGKSVKHWWTGVIIYAMAAGLWYMVHSFCSMGLTNLIVLTVMVVFFFELYHVRNRKASLILHCLFSLAVAAIAVSAVLYRESLVIHEYILLFLYLLTESNQNYLKKTYEESVISYQNGLLTKQVNEVQNMYLTMRGWRHDYHNHLQTLKAHLKLGQVREAQVYLDRLELDLDNINQLIESGNVNLDAILNSKLSLALKEDIEINYKAEVPQVLTVSDIDLCVLIGNLIDNAVEACNKMTEQEGAKFVRLYIGVLKKQLYISVTNATNEQVRKMDEDYITTKRGNHGHGLKRINNIVEKYEGYINRKNEPGVFVTEIMLPL
jgi:Signal transduction histidine kinase regulating citrate/malate metabolism